MKLHCVCVPSAVAELDPLNRLIFCKLSVSVTAVSVLSPLVDDPGTPQSRHLLRLHRDRPLWGDSEDEGGGSPR